MKYKGTWRHNLDCEWKWSENGYEDLSRKTNENKESK